MNTDQERPWAVLLVSFSLSLVFVTLFQRLLPTAEVYFTGTAWPAFACGSFLGVSEEIQPNVGQKIGLGTREFELEEVPPAEDVTAFLCNDTPAGAKLGKVFAKKGDVYPSGGFKREDEVDLEDLRLP